MSSYIALLRGINLVGNSSLKMAELREIADGLGLEKARTYIASGNLLFSSDNSEEELQLMLQSRLRSHMNKDVRVFLRTAREMAAVVSANPFATANARNVQVFFLNEPPPADLLVTVRNCDDEQIACGAREVYVAYGEKGIGHSRLRVPAADAGTARNMNTVAKLAALAREA